LFLEDSSLSTSTRSRTAVETWPSHTFIESSEPRSQLLVSAKWTSTIEAQTRQKKETLSCATYFPLKPVNFSCLLFNLI
jgi:hypothetical protein